MTTTRTSQDAESRATDRKLVRACLGGDRTAWETLIRRHRRLIYSIPIKLGLDGADADEVFQQVAIKMIEKLGDLRDAGSLPAWLAVTARRECYGLLQRGKCWVQRDDSAEPIATSADPAEDLHLVACEHALVLALGRLDPTCRELLKGLYYEQPPPSYEALSRRLGRPIGSLGPTRSRCLAKLRRFYAEVGGPGF